MDDRTPENLTPRSFGDERDNFEPVDMENSDDDDARSMSESSQICCTPGGDGYSSSKPSSIINQDTLPSTPQHYASETSNAVPSELSPQFSSNNQLENNDVSPLSQNTQSQQEHHHHQHHQHQHYQQQQQSSQSTTSTFDDRTHADKHRSSKSMHANGDKHHHSETTTRTRQQPSKRFVQVMNVSPLVTLEQITTLFGTVGDIENILLFPGSDIESQEINFKVCFIEFAKAASALVALHLTNTVFVDRALVVLPYKQLELPPDSQSAIQIAHDSDFLVQYNRGFTNQIVTGVGGAQFIATIDPKLVTMGASQYPPLPINTEPARIEEIRRTVYVGNLDSTIHPDQVLKFFNDIGEVKYIRVAGDETQPTRFAFVEFTHQSSIASAVQHNGVILGSRALKINHSNNAIVKPQPRIEIEDLSKSRRDRDSRGSRDHRHSSRRDISPKDKDRYRGRRVSPYSRSRHRRSSDREISPRRRSHSRDRAHRRSRSPRDKGSRRSRSREDRRRRSKNNSDERSSSKRHKSHR